jgi:hypothetical protein
VSVRPAWLRCPALDEPAAVERVRSNVVQVPGEWAAGEEGRSHRPRALAGFWYCRSRESSRTN